MIESRRGRLKVVQDCLAAYFQPSLRDWVALSNSTQGYRPGLSSVVPPGLSLEWSSHTLSKAVVAYSFVSGHDFSRALEFLSELNPRQMTTQAPPSPLSSRAQPRDLQFTQPATNDDPNAALPSQSSALPGGE
jgi:hypothetical protein